MSDKCQRCGEEGEDRRMLWMACFYEMSELDVPFVERPAFTCREPAGYATIHQERKVEFAEGTNLVARSGDPVPHGDYLFKKMFTLLVCKDCRSEWMGAIQTWFKEKAAPSCGSGIFVRRNGANVEITEEEWFSLNPGREPVRAKVG